MEKLDNTYKKYQSYTVEELLEDDFFISSVLNPTDETDAFWMKAIEEEVISLHDYKLARYFIDSVHPKQEEVSIEEAYDLWQNIEVTNKRNIRNKKKRLSFFLSATAGIAALLAIVLLLNITPSVEDQTILSNIEAIKAPALTSSDIQLILADNQAISLDGKEAEIAYNSKGIAINNQQTQLSEQAAAYNQLIVPYGKRSMLTLAEGTKIWVNAGTRVVYPASFEGENREIYIDGEAYLDVEKDENRPFIVKTQNMSVKVLGTSFNIMAYEKDTIQHVVLVEGSVQVNSPERRDAILVPNEICQLVNGRQEIKTVDVEDYISWKSGIYKYKSESLGIIVQRLSRYYGEEIACSPSVSRLTCSGKLDLKDDLKIVLEGITHTAPVNYTFDGQTHKITNEQ